MKCTVHIRTHNTITPASSKECLGIQATIECGFTLKRVRDMIRTYNQMHCTDMYSQHGSIIWPVWLNGWVFVYIVSGCEFEYCCIHLNFRHQACFKQRVFLNFSLTRVGDIIRTYNHTICSLSVQDPEEQISFS